MLNDLWICLFISNRGLISEHERTDQYLVALRQECWGPASCVLHFQVFIIPSRNWHKSHIFDKPKTKKKGAWKYLSFFEHESFSNGSCNLGIYISVETLVFVCLQKTLDNAVTLQGSVVVLWRLLSIINLHNVFFLAHPNWNECNESWWDQSCNPVLHRVIQVQQLEVHHWVR